MANFSFVSKTNEHIENYTHSMILSTRKKNCSAMSQEVDITKEQLYKLYKNPEESSKQIRLQLRNLIKKYHSPSKTSVAIIDPTIIRKWFAEKMEGIACDWDGVIDKSKACLAPVVAAWTNGVMTLPFDFEFWMNKKLVDFYQKKSEFAKALILEFIKVIQIDYVALDGAFCSLEMIDFFNEIEIHFCMRIAKNSIIVSKNGIEAQLQNHPELKLKGNQRYKTIQGTRKGRPAFFTAHKIYSKRTRKPRIVFIISDIEVSAIEQVKAYGLRWKIEKMFRTMKQKLGLQDCQCLSIEKQRAHIFATFLAYAELEIMKVKMRLKSPEEALKLLRREKHAKRIERRRMERVVYA